MASGSGLSCGSSTLPSSKRPEPLSFLSGVACETAVKAASTAQVTTTARITDRLGFISLLLSHGNQGESLMGQVQARVFAFVIVDVNRHGLSEAHGLAIGAFHAFQIGPDNVVGFARRNALGKLAHMVGIKLPADLLGLVGGSADFHRDAVHRTIIGPPHSARNQGVRFFFLFVFRRVWAGS